jgi:hypothetical protein
MWSPYYDGFIIRASAGYDQVADTQKVKSMLDALPELKPVELMRYKNADGYPPLDLLLVKSRNGNYAHCSDTWHDAFNMIQIECAKKESLSGPTAQRAFLIKIAQLLGWELIQEDDDDSDEEDILIWKPQ